MVVRKEMILYVGNGVQEDDIGGTVARRDDIEGEKKCGQ